MKFSGKVGKGQLNKWWNFGGDSVNTSGYGHGSAQDVPWRRHSMHCPSASSYGRPIIFCPVVSSIFLLSFFPRLILAVADCMSTILLHMVWP